MLKNFLTAAIVGLIICAGVKVEAAAVYIGNSPATGRDCYVLTDTIYHYFDCINEEIWTGTVVTKKKLFTTPQDMRNRIDSFPRIANGGWHFSYMGGVDRVINKMTSIRTGNLFVVHSGGKLIDRKHIEKSLANGTDIYNRQGKAFQYFSYDARNIRLPYLEEFLRKYPYFLREPEKYFGG